jgi:hypothetical protein
LLESAVGREGQPLVVHVQVGVGHGNYSSKSVKPISLMASNHIRSTDVTWCLPEGHRPRCLNVANDIQIRSKIFLSN